MDYQIRLRDSNEQRVMEALEAYFTDRFMIFRHEPHGENIHYHVYIFGLQRTAETIRDHLHKLRYPKEYYAVKTTCGKKKEKITPQGAYQYAVKPKSNPKIVKTKGFSDEELAEFKEKADRYYHNDIPIVVSPSDANVPEVIFRVDRVWERLKKDIKSYDKKTVREIKSSIASDWLNQGKAIPRPSDLHRYAVSLYYLNKYQHEDCVPEDALLPEY